MGLVADALGSGVGVGLSTSEIGAGSRSAVAKSQATTSIGADSRGKIVIFMVETIRLRRDALRCCNRTNRVCRPR